MRYSDTAGGSLGTSTICVPPGAGPETALRTNAAVVSPAIPRGGSYYPAATCAAPPPMPSGPQPMSYGPPPGVNFNCHLDEFNGHMNLNCNADFGGEGGPHGPIGNMHPSIPHGMPHSMPHGCEMEGNTCKPVCPPGYTLQADKTCLQN